MPLVRALVLAVLVMLPAVGQAQAAVTPWRVLVGMTAARLAAGRDFSQPLYGFSVGVAGVYPARARLALVPELQLVEKGGVDHRNGGAVGADIRTLDAALSVRMRRSRSARTGAYLAAGPTVGFVLSCVSGAETAGDVLIGNCTSQLHRVDAGVHVAGGLEFDAVGTRWGTELRYQHGIADISRDRPHVGTRTWQLLVSFHP